MTLMLTGSEGSDRLSEIFPGISMDPHVRFGKPCLTATRIDVATIVGHLLLARVMLQFRKRMPSLKSKYCPRSAMLHMSPSMCPQPLSRHC